MLYARNRGVTLVHCLSVSFPVPGIQHRQENILILFHILNNSDNLNSVHCLYLLFAICIYVYCFCFLFFYMFYVQRATW